jgi:hypothetical protein
LKIEEDKMNTRKILLVLTGILLLGAAPATATGSEATAFPETITVVCETSEPNGIAVRRNGTSLCEWGVFKIDLYRVALYLERPSRNAREVIESDQVKHMELHFLRSLSKRQMRRAYRASFEANAAADLDRFQERIDRFVAMMPAVKKGEQLAFTCFPGQGLGIRHGRKILGRIPGDDFGQLFFRLYVGSIPPTPEVRKGLLGLPGNA